MFLRLLITLLRLKGRLRRIRPLDAKAVRSVLIVELTRLGDVITALPAIRSIITNFSHADVTLVVDEQYAPLLRAFGLQCTVRGLQQSETMRGFIQAVQFVREKRYDLALSLSPPKRNAAVALASRSLRRAGYLSYSHTLTPYLETTPIESFGFQLNQQLSFGRESIEQRSAKVCEALGFEVSSIHRETLDGNLLRFRQERLLKENSLTAGDYVVLHPFSGWKFRSWPLERFAALAEIMIKRTKYRVLFLCEQLEQEKLLPLRERFASRDNVTFFASGDLLDTAMLIEKGALVVCNDSGPLHLAAALGKPVVGLFGPAAPELTAPHNAAGVYHYKQLECSPCDQCACVRPNEPCMTFIEPEDVATSVINMLASQRAQPAVAHA